MARLLKVKITTREYLADGWWDGRPPPKSDDFVEFIRSEKKWYTTKEKFSLGSFSPRDRLFLYTRRNKIPSYDPYVKVAHSKSTRLP